MENDMNRICRSVILAGMLLAVSACGSSPPVRYYSLEALDARYGGVSEVMSGLGVGPLRMPDYLSRSRIVTRRGNAELLVDDFNRWAEPVDDEVHRIVAANLDGLLDDMVVVAFPFNHYARLDGQVVGRVDRFDTDQDGRVVLLVQWGIRKPDADFVVPPRRAHYETQASDASDYGSIAAAMSAVLAEFSRDIAREFEAAPVE